MRVREGERELYATERERETERETERGGEFVEGAAYALGVNADD